MALPDVAYRLIGRFSVTRFDRVLHPRLYRLVGGRGVIGRPLGSEVLLLTTTGRRSGRSRTVALFGFRREGGWIVVASRGGSRVIPAWYRNLVAEPAATVRIGRMDVPIRAVELFGEAYESAFEVAAARYRGYRLYRQQAGYHIPILRLEPIKPVERTKPIEPTETTRRVEPS